MKILFEVGSTSIGGAERVVLKLAHGLHRRFPKWIIDCVVLYEHGGLREEYEATFDNLWPPPLNYNDSSWWIINLVEEHGYRIVHAIDSFHLVAAAAPLCPKTHFIQNVFPNIDKSPFGPTAEWLADTQNHYSAIVTEFKANLERLPRPGRPPHILAAIPNGIDTTFWTPGLARRCLDVTWCARTDTEKGIAVALDLVPLLCRQGLVYRIITSESDGPQEELAELKRQWPHFTCAAALPAKQLRFIFQQTKLFLSTSSVEGMPATPIEAAACGCSLLLPEIDGLAEVFAGHPEWLYAAKQQNADYLAGRIHELFQERYIGDPQNPVEPDAPQGSTLARSIAERYDLKAMAENYVGLYERLLSTTL